MPSPLTSAIATLSAVLSLGFFAWLLHVSRTQPAPSSSPGSIPPQLRSSNSSLPQILKCSALQQQQCVASGARCTWQAGANVCVRSASSKHASRRAHKVLSSKQMADSRVAGSVAQAELQATSGNSKSSACTGLAEQPCDSESSRCVFDRVKHECLPRVKRRVRLSKGTQVFKS